MSVGALFLASLCGIGKLLLLSFVGALAAQYPAAAPVLPLDAQKHLARLATFVVMPASIVFGLGSNISLDSLQTMSVLISWSLLHTALSAAVASSCFWALLPSISGQLRRVLVGATSFHNAVALPLLMVDFLCEQPALEHVDDCKPRGLAACFVYLLPWQLMFWSVGFAVFSSTEEDLPVVAAKEPPEVREVECSFELVRAKGVADEMAEQGDAGQEPLESVEQGQDHSCTSWGQSIRRVFLQPCMIAIPVALFCGLIAPVRDTMFAPESPVGSTLSALTDALLAMTTMLMAAGLFSPSSDALPAIESPQRIRLVVVFCAVRLVVVPSVGIWVFWLVKSRWPSLVGDAVQQLVILIEFGSASSQSAVVVCQAAGARRTSAMLAHLYLWQYLLGMVTLTCVTTMALEIALT